MERRVAATFRQLWKLDGRLRKNHPSAATNHAHLSGVTDSGDGHQPVPERRWWTDGERDAVLGLSSRVAGAGPSWRRHRLAWPGMGSDSRKLVGMMADCTLRTSTIAKANAEQGFLKTARKRDENQASPWPKQSHEGTLLEVTAKATHHHNHHHPSPLQLTTWLATLCFFVPRVVVVWWGAVAVLCVPSLLHSSFVHGTRVSVDAMGALVRPFGSEID
jgi:hypothetical protein